MIKPHIRIARDSDAAEVERILRECNLVPAGLDWSRVEPCFLVAEYKGAIVGCVQVLIGYPLGHIGLWAIEPKWQNYGFGIFLLRAAEKTLAHSGCDGFTGLTDHPAILKKLEKDGAIIFGPPVNWLFKRIYRGKAETNEVLQPAAS